MLISHEINLYLRGTEFRDELVKQYERFEILAEGALRTAVANLLRARLEKMDSPAERYRVTCETHLSKINVVPDVLIWKGKHPRIWIELKDTRRFDKAKVEADWEKLRKNCPIYPSIKAGYLIYVARLDNGGFALKRTRETLRYWPVPIALEHHIVAFPKWDTEYERRAHYVVPKAKTRAASAGR